MGTVTVPSGSGGSPSNVSLNFTSDAGASLAISLLSQVYAAHNSGALNVYPSPSVGGATNEYVIAPSVSGSVTIPAGYDDIIDASNAAVTVTGNGDSGELVVVGTNGPLDFIANGGSGTVVGGGAAVTVISGGSGVFTIAGDSDASAVAYFSQGDVTGASEVILTGDGAAVTTSGAGATIIGSASGSAFIVNSGGGNTVEAGGGQTTISALAGGGYYTDTTGNLIFVNGAGSSVVVGGSGSVAAFNGGGSGSYVAGSGLFLLVNGSGSGTITAGQGSTATGISAGLFNGSGGSLTLIGGSPNGVNSYMIAGNGSETLNAAASTSTVGFVTAGVGSSALISTSTTATDYVLASPAAVTVVGGGAPDIFVFNNGAAGGTDLFQNWNASDVMLFYGYGDGGTANISGALATTATTQTSAGYAASITLPDNTRITFTSATPFTLSNNAAYFG